jgi:hypothetical protein
MQSIVRVRVASAPSRVAFALPTHPEFTALALARVDGARVRVDASRHRAARVALCGRLARRTDISSA